MPLTTLAELYPFIEEQRQHDHDYHLDIHDKDNRHIRTHLTLHLFKYAGDLQNPETRWKPYKRIAQDTMLTLLSFAQNTNYQLPNRFAYNITVPMLKPHASHFMNFGSTLVAHGARIAAALEKQDHGEHNEATALAHIHDALDELFYIIMALAQAHNWDLAKAVYTRRQEIKNSCKKRAQAT